MDQNVSDERGIKYRDALLEKLAKENEMLREEALTVPVLKAQVRQKRIYILFLKSKM